MYGKLKVSILFVFSAVVVFAEHDVPEAGWSKGDPEHEYQQQEKYLRSEGIPEMSELDKAGDGYITREEARAHDTVNQYFNWADVDGDRRLSKKEYSRLKGLFKQQDEQAE